MTPVSSQGRPPTHEEVHVWVLGLDLAPSRLEALGDILSADERRRAGRFHHALHRDRFVAARGQLREILAGYLRVRPVEVVFAQGPQGKPRLAHDDAPRFSLSHSEDKALLAVSRDREVGIDIERIRAGVECETIARRFFSSAETESLLSLPPGSRPQAFFAVWTRKEAFVKAKGGGLGTIALADFDVSLEPTEPVGLLRTACDPRETERWSLQDLEAPAGFSAAIAVEVLDRRPHTLIVRSPREPRPLDQVAP